MRQNQQLHIWQHEQSTAIFELMKIPDGENYTLMRDSVHYDW